MRALAPLALVVSIAGGACVSSGTYDDLLMAHERNKRDLHEAVLVRDSESERRREAEAALAQTRGDKATTEQSLASLKAQQTQTQADYDRASAELKKKNDELAAAVRDRAGLKDSLSDLQAALKDANERKAEADRRLAEFRSLLDRFAKLIDAGKLKVKIVDGRMVVALNSDVLFASGKAELSADGKAAIDEVATLLATIPERAFQIEGHTDNVPIKTAQFPSNWELASARAVTVLKTMVAAGMPAARLSAASYGDQKEAASNKTPEGRAQNRRIEIVVVPDLSTLPGFNELKAASK